MSGPRSDGRQAAGVDPVGTLFGSYRVVSVLGRGGMGVVYLVEHTIMGKQAAVKVLRPELSGKQDLVLRFFNEARAAARLDHPAFVEVYDCGDANGRAFMVMEYVPGESLAAFLTREVRLSGPRAVELIRLVAKAMTLAHENGIVHRDLKPDNIIVTSARKASRQRPSPIKILDFGIAKLTAASRDAPVTRTGVAMGTPLYMSPEQCKGDGKVDARSDVYSLGCVLYALLTGTPPFVRAGEVDVILAHLMDPVPPLSNHGVIATPSLEQLIGRALAKDPADRYQSMAELVAGLDALDLGAAGHDASASADPPAAARLSQDPFAIPLMGSTTFSRTSGEMASQPDAPPNVRRRAWKIGALVASLAAVGGLLIARPWQADTNAEKPSAAVTTTPGQPAPILPAPAGSTIAPEPAAPVRRISVKLASAPPGARVIKVSDRTVLGVTPFEVSFSRSDELLELVVDKGGYKPQTVKLKLDGDFDKTVKLQRRRARPAPIDPDEARKL